MNRLLSLGTIFLLLLCGSCHSYDEWDDDSIGNFEALCSIIDEHYCFFDEKGVDWPAVTARYRREITPATTRTELFDICSRMLAELRDGHVNLSSQFDTFYYRAWWTDYPQDFNLRTLQQYYLHFDYHTASGILYRRLTTPSGRRVGYMYISSFSSPIGETSLSYVLASFDGCDALIIDIRNNSGGMLTSVETLARRFITAPVTVGYIRHKTGPGHSDFSEPYPVTYEPAPSGQISWAGRVALLTNRSCYSAANDCAMVLGQLPQVTHIGARTGGGSGLPFSAGLPCGWNLRFSACPMTDARGHSVEEGIDPHIEVHCNDEDLARGHDAILDYALSYFDHP